MDCREILSKYYYQLLELCKWEPCETKCTRCCPKKQE